MCVDARAIVQSLSAFPAKSDDAYDLFAAFRIKHQIGMCTAYRPITNMRSHLSNKHKK